MRARILRIVFSIIVMIFVSLVLAQRAPHNGSTNADSVNTSGAAVMQATSTGPSFLFNLSANQLNIANPAREPLLLLLLGGLLLAVASSIRRLTKLRHQP